MLLALAGVLSHDPEGGPSKTQDGIEFVRIAEVVDHKALAILQSPDGHAEPGIHPDVGVDDGATPLGAEGLHGAARAGPTKQVAGNFLLIPLEVLLLEADCPQHHLNGVSELQQ